MAKCEIPIKVYMEEIEELIEELKQLQTYKLAEGDDMKLVPVDDVIKVLSRHVKTSGHWIYYSGIYECSKCKCIQEHWSRFCPDCGSENGGIDEDNS